MSAELELLSRIRTLADAVAAFSDDDRCRRLLEAMVWPRGRLCPACGCHRSTSLAGRDTGRRARPGLYQCSDQDCRQQFTVTTRTPLHATKLPLRTWLLGRNCSRGWQPRLSGEGEGSADQVLDGVPG
jgi:hypothetical protein